MLDNDPDILPRRSGFGDAVDKSRVSAVYGRGAMHISDRPPEKKGNFAAGLDGLVEHFPHEAQHPKARGSPDEARALQEKRDIHALLFERAWALDREHDEDSA